MSTRIPLRLLILQRLVEHLYGLTEADGYHFTLTDKNVHRGRSILGAESAVSRETRAVVSIIEAPRPDIAAYAGEWNEARHDMWTLLIQGQTFTDLRDSDQAYFLCADVEQHLSRITAVRAETGNPVYPDVFNLGGLITSLEIAPPVVRPPEDRVSTAAFFFLPVRVGIAVKVGEPYRSL